jgi:ABC-type phosphate transport system substrate-binding protein
LIDKRSLGAIFALIAVVAVVSTARADDSIAVIVGKHPPHISLDRSNLEDIFLKRILVDDDRSALVPLNLASEALQRYWTERYFHGITPPYTVRSQESMLRYVADTPGAVGYVASCSVDDRVNVAARLPVPAEWASQIHRLCEKSGAE